MSGLATRTTRGRPVPATVITGFLGSGKTTLLNHILTADHGRRIAVIVNEFGEVGIDGQLVIGVDEEIIEMNNGCICCTMRGDLIRIIGSLLTKEDRFDHLIIETTGLADPAPVIQSFVLDETLHARMELDAVVTVVDCKHIVAHWDSMEATEQIAFADVLLLNKTDLVTQHDIDSLTLLIRQLNPFAKVYPTTNSRIDLDRILHIKAFDLQHALSLDPQLLGEDTHVHDQSVRSVCIREAGRLDASKLSKWLYDLLQFRGPDIFRLKGILNIDTEDRRFVVHGVHMLLDGRPGLPWTAAEPRTSDLVFIGRNLDEGELRRGFHACLT